MLKFCPKLALSIIVTITAVIYYKYITFKYYHPVYEHHNAQPTFLQNVEASGWNNQSVRNYALSSQEIYKFKRDGFIVIRNAIPVKIIDVLYIHRPKHSLSPYLQFFESWMLSETNTHFMFDCLWSFIDEYRDFWYYSPLIKYYIAPILADDNNNTSIRLLTDLLFGIKQTPLKLGVFKHD